VLASLRTAMPLRQQFWSTYSLRDTHDLRLFHKQVNLKLDMTTKLK
jgi:hypothetical protein